MIDQNERQRLEARGIYPSLFGRTVLVIDEGDMEEKHRHELVDRQRMGFSFRDTLVLNDFLPTTVTIFGFESTAIHIPVIQDAQRTLDIEDIVGQVRGVCPRTILLTGHPSWKETIESYDRLKSSGFILVPK